MGEGERDRKKEKNGGFRGLEIGALGDGGRGERETEKKGLMRGVCRIIRGREERLLKRID